MARCAFVDIPRPANVRQQPVITLCRHVNTGDPPRISWWDAQPMSVGYPEGETTSGRLLSLVIKLRSWWNPEGKGRCAAGCGSNVSVIVPTYDNC